MQRTLPVINVPPAIRGNGNSFCSKKKSSNSCLEKRERKIEFLDNLVVRKSSEEKIHLIIRVSESAVNEIAVGFLFDQKNLRSRARLHITNNSGNYKRERSSDWQWR